MSKERITDEQIKRARSVPLAEYLLASGERLKREGSRYKHGEHDSLVITDNKYFWNSRNEGGNTVDFLTRHRGMTFPEAVKDLLNFELLGGLQPVVQPVEQLTDDPGLYDIFNWTDIELTTDLRRTIAYLTKTRKISAVILQELIDNRLLFQEIVTNNAVFPIYDEKQEIVGAETAGTLSDKRFKGVKAGSKYGYGFNNREWLAPKFGLFFESAIDLISFMDIERLKGKSLKDCLLISMAGLKENIVSCSLEAVKGGFQPVLCVDNDSAGTEFITAMKDQKYGNVVEHRPEPAFKDWNDQLQALKGNQ